MTATHSTIETTRPGDLVRRFECPACRFTIETPWNGVNPRVTADDPAVAHTGDWQDAARLAFR